MKEPGLGSCGEIHTDDNQMGKLRSRQAYLSENSEEWQSKLHTQISLLLVQCFCYRTKLLTAQF